MRQGLKGDMGQSLQSLKDIYPGCPGVKNYFIMHATAAVPQG